VFRGSFWISDFIEHDPSLVVGAVNEVRPIESFAALGVQPREPTAHGRASIVVTIHHDEIHEFGDTGVGRRSGFLIARDDDVDEEADGGPLVGGEELSLVSAKGEW
jgi:hypothetical protein